MPALVSSRIRGIVFDLWNTLAYNDHLPNPILALGDAFGLRHRPRWRKVLEEAMMRDELAGIEEGIAAISRLTGRSLEASQVEELVRNWREACTRSRLFPEVSDVLQRLGRHYPLGLLSNTQSFDNDMPGLAALPFKARVFSYELGRLKPDEEMFLRMAERLGLPPAHLLMVGDNLEDDILGAEAAGLQGLLIRRSQAQLSFTEISPERQSLPTLHPLPALLGA